MNNNETNQKQGQETNLTEILKSVDGLVKTHKLNQHTEHKNKKQLKIAA